MENNKNNLYVNGFVESIKSPVNENKILYFQFDDDEPIEIGVYSGKIIIDFDGANKIIFKDGDKKFKIFAKPIKNI